MRTLSIISSLICAAFSFMACAQDNVFEQPAVEMRVHVPDLAQRIDSVVEGRITGIDRRAGVFSINGRRVQFAASYDEQFNPYMNPPPEPAPLPACAGASCTLRSCDTGTCGLPVSYAAPLVDIPVTVESPCPAGGCATGKCGSCESAPCPLPVSYEPDEDYLADVVPAPRSSVVIRPSCPSGNCGGCAGGACGYPGAETVAAPVYVPPFPARISGIPYAAGFAEDITNGSGGAYRPFSFGNFTIGTHEAQILNGQSSETVVGYKPYSPDLLASMPKSLQHSACACTRIVLHAAAGMAAGPENAPPIRPTRRLQPELNYKFFGPDSGEITLMNSADFNQPGGLETGNVLHPIENGTMGAPAADDNCVCSGMIVITPNNPRFTAQAPRLTANQTDDSNFVAMQQEPMEVFTGNPNDTIFAVKSLPAGSVRDLKVGDEVLVGYNSGITDSPQFVIKASPAR
jgi:hypothetical protein